MDQHKALKLTCNEASRSKYLPPNFCSRVHQPPAQDHRAWRVSHLEASSTTIQDLNDQRQHIAWEGVCHGGGLFWSRGMLHTASFVFIPCCTPSVPSSTLRPRQTA